MGSGVTCLKLLGLDSTWDFCWSTSEKNGIPAWLQTKVLLLVANWGFIPQPGRGTFRGGAKQEGIQTPQETVVSSGHP